MKDEMFTDISIITSLDQGKMETYEISRCFLPQYPTSGSASHNFPPLYVSPPLICC